MSQPMLTDLMQTSMPRDRVEGTAAEYNAFHDAPTCEVPWYLPLAGEWSMKGFNRMPPGRWVTNKMVRLLEAVRVAPRGSATVSDFLNRGADALVCGGEAGIFTPMFFFHARKRG